MPDFVVHNDNSPIADVMVSTFEFEAGHVRLKQDGKTVWMTADAFREVAERVLVELGDDVPDAEPLAPWERELRDAFENAKCGAAQSAFVCTRSEGHAGKHIEFSRFDGSALAWWQ